MRETIIVALASGVFSGGFLAFIQFLITRHDSKNDKKDGIQAELSLVKSELELIKKEIDKKFRKSEKDGLRMQLLFLIRESPGEKQEIMTVGEHYFKVLKGDWYMTSIFNKWLKKYDIAEPDWFDSKE